jgi:succinate-semialdehyde dehydrogenase
VESLVSRAKVAFKEFQSFDQEKVDAVIKAACLALKKNAFPLARLAVEDTTFGVLETKAEKNDQAANAIWYALKGKKSMGIIDEDPEKGLIYIAKPVGIVASVVPSTNPTTTIAFNIAYILKGKNAVIISPHPGALKTSLETIRIMKDAAVEAGAPEDIIQVIEYPDYDLSTMLMAACDRVIVAGPPKTVEAGYSSGHPSIGIAHGNLQFVVDRGVDYETAVRTAAQGANFDNALVCACTQSLIIPEEIKSEALKWIASEAVYIAQGSEAEKIKEALYPCGIFNKKCTGKNVQFIASLCGVTVPESARAILILQDRYEDDDPVLAGQHAPLFTLRTYNRFEEVYGLIKTALEKDGKGHAGVIYSNDEDRIREFALRLPLTRILVNQSGLNAANQQLKNGQEPTANLGCGSWANNGESENITFRHFLNICKIIKPLPEDRQPTEADIWAD